MADSHLGKYSTENYGNKDVLMEFDEHKLSSDLESIRLSEYFGEIKREETDGAPSCRYGNPQTLSGANAHAYAFGSYGPPTQQGATAHAYHGSYVPATQYGGHDLYTMTGPTAVAVKPEPCDLYPETTLLSLNPPEMDSELSIAEHRFQAPVAPAQMYGFRKNALQTWGNQSHENLFEPKISSYNPIEDKLSRLDEDENIPSVGSEQKHLAWREKAQRTLMTSSTETGSDVIDESEEMTFEQDELGDGPLHTLAVLEDTTWLAKYLEVVVNAGVLNKAVNLQNKYKQTPLFLSINARNYGFSSWLLDHGADPCIQGTLYTDTDTYIWRSPLHLAATFGDRDVRFITLLLSKGADINQLSHGDQLTALHIALRCHGTSRPCKLAVMELIKKGANIEIRDQANSKTPFMLALETRDLKLIEEFLLSIPAAFKTEDNIMGSEEANASSLPKGKPTRKLMFRQGSRDSTPHGEAADYVLIAKKTPDEELMELLRILHIDAMAECSTDSFPAFRHGCAAIQAIVTRGKDILDMPEFNETENNMMKSECIQIYTSSALMNEINTSNTDKLNRVEHACLEELNISFPVIVIVEQDTKTIIEKWTDAQNENICGICVLLVNRGQEEEHQYLAPKKGIFLSMATLCDVMVAADDILERSIFFVLRHLTEVYLEKYQPATDLSDTETESTLQSVYAYARAAYQRSEVPKCEIPHIPLETYTYPENIDKVIKTLLTIEGVVGCSKKLGRLEVSINDTKDREKTVDKVKMHLTNESIKVTFVYGQFTYYLCSGDQVQGQKGIKGTLGGFAKRFVLKTTIDLNKRAETGRVSPSISEESARNICASTNTCTIYNRTETARASASSPGESAGKLVALISRHVANANNKMGTMHLLVCNTIIGHTDNIHQQTLLDIIPIDIYNCFIEDCKTQFKTEKNQFKHGQLLDKELRSTLIGTKVYIWGAVSSPGLGTLEEIDFKMTDGLCIKVCDRNNGKPFSYPGDSGAIVCATDSRERNLYPIAMLMGKYEGKNPPTYMAVLLDEAFEKLKELYGSDFRLCEDDGTTK